MPVLTRANATPSDKYHQLLTFNSMNKYLVFQITMVMIEEVFIIVSTIGRSCVLTS